MSAEDATTLLYYNYQNIVFGRGCQFIETGDTISQIRQFAAAITSESNKFGIFLCGTCGNGKTTLLRAFKASVAYLDKQNAFAEDMQRSHQRYDANFREAKSLARIAKDDEEWRKITQCKVLIVDDCGTEPAEIVDYGNILNPLADLIEYRYAQQLFTIISTNLTPEEFSDKYGKRVADRMTEMMDKIIFKNSSFRRN